MESITGTESFSSKLFDTDLYQQTPQMYSMQNIAIDTRRTLLQPWILILQIFFFSFLLFTLIKSTKQQLKTPRCDLCRNVRKVSAEKILYVILIRDTIIPRVCFSYLSCLENVWPIHSIIYVYKLFEKEIYSSLQIISIKRAVELFLQNVGKSQIKEKELNCPKSIGKMTILKTIDNVFPEMISSKHLCFINRKRFIELYTKSTKSL